MVSRVQNVRSSTKNARPPNATRQPGEFYVNFADKQLGVIDTSQVPQDLIAVRFHSTLTDYVLGDHVIQNGKIYRANGPVPAGAFNVAQWETAGMADAPSNGKLWGRVNGAWEQPEIGDVLTLQAELDLRAPLANPAFSGVPTAPTAATATNTAQIATTAFVKNQGYALAESAVPDGDKGDIAVSNSGATWMFDSAVVTPAAKSVLDDTSTAAMLTTLGAAPASHTHTTAQVTGLDTALAGKVNKVGDTMSGPLTVYGTGYSNFQSAFAVGDPKAAGFGFDGAGNAVINLVGGINLNITSAGGPSRATFYSGGGLALVTPITGVSTLNVPAALSGIYALQAFGSTLTGAMIGFAVGNSQYGICGYSTTPLNYSFYGNGTAYLASGTWTVSDRRFKENIAPATMAALAMVAAIPVVEFNFHANSPVQSELSGPQQFGWLAQDVEPIIPAAVGDIHAPKHDLAMRAFIAGAAVPEEKSPEAEALSERDDLTHKAINDRYMLAVLWKAVQELSAQVAKLQA